MKTLIISLTLVFSTFTTIPLKAQQQKPNFLFILVDDLGYYDVSYNGSTFYETPNIDQLSQSGMRFDQGYAACQVCSPSRASIMLGKTPARHGITQWIGSKAENYGGRPVTDAPYVWNLPAQETTLAEALKKAGYTTFFAGKWHLGSEGSWPEDHGFDINVGGWDSGSPSGGYFAPWINPRLPNGPDGQSLTLRLADEAVSFIESHKNESFLAYLSFYAVHGPIQTTHNLWNKYRDKAGEMGLTDNNPRFIFDRRLAVRQVQDNPIYAGMMETLDNAVGKVLQALKQNGLDQNTVVIFTGDNGGVTSGDAFSTSLLPLRGGKGRQWEGGIREPFIIDVPGMTKTGLVSQVPVIGMDFYPTILELAGLPLKPGQHVDGMSLVPVMQGKTVDQRDLFWHYPHYGNQGGEPSSIIRSGNWKLIFYHEDGRYELYNLLDDIGEQYDLSGKKPQLLDKLKKRLHAWLTETGAVMPEKNDSFNPDEFNSTLEKLRTEKMPELERQHADYLKKEWEPGNNWWGSTID